MKKIIPILLMASSVAHSAGFATGYVVGTSVAHSQNNNDSSGSNMLTYFDGVLTCDANYQSISYGYLMDGCRDNFRGNKAVSVSDMLKRYVPRGKIVAVSYIYTYNRIEIYYVSGD